MGLCEGSNHAMCKFANALLFTDQKGVFDIYLLGGDISPETLAIYINHNDEHHRASTYEQLGRLIRILSTRNYLLGTTHDVNQILKATERRIEAYNHQKRLERIEQARIEANNTNELPNASNDGDESIVVDLTDFLGLSPDGSVPANEPVQEPTAGDLEVQSTSNAAPTVPAPPKSKFHTLRMTTRSVSKRLHQN